MFCSKGGILECVLWNWKHIHALRPMVRHCMEMLIWNGHTPHFLLGPLKPVQVWRQITVKDCMTHVQGRVGDGIQIKYVIGQSKPLFIVSFLPVDRKMVRLVWNLLCLLPKALYIKDISLWIRIGLIHVIAEKCIWYKFWCCII